MRVLHVDTGHQMRGGQYQVLFLMEELVRMGHPCLLLAPADAPLAQRAAASSIPVRRLSLRTLRSAARTYDVVHTHTGRAHAFAAVAGARPLVVARRVAFPVRDGWASRWKYRRGDRYIAVSRYVARKLEDAGVQGDRIGVVYDGVPVLRPAEGAKILAPASDDPRKGTALVERASKRAGFAVKFSANLPVDLAEAGIFVYLTEEEGLGSAVLLAMSAGVPVVASRVGGLPEIVEDPVTGVLVENNELEVAAAIQRLLNDPEAAAQMGRTARERVQQRFTLRHMAEQTLAVYDNVI